MFVADCFLCDISCIFLEIFLDRRTELVDVVVHTSRLYCDFFTIDICSSNQSHMVED